MEETFTIKVTKEQLIMLAAAWREFDEVCWVHENVPEESESDTYFYDQWNDLGYEILDQSAYYEQLHQLEYQKI